MSSAHALVKSGKEVEAEKRRQPAALAALWKAEKREDEGRSWVIWIAHENQTKEEPGHSPYRERETEGGRERSPD